MKSDLHSLEEIIVSTLILRKHAASVIRGEKGRERFTEEDREIVCVCSSFRMEAKYLKDNLGCLTTCLKEVAEKRPHDPIEYIAFWLRKFVENERIKAQKEEEAKRLLKEQEEEAIDKERRARRLEEARRLAEEEAARRKAEEEKRAREAASASKLPVVEEKEEPDIEAPAAESGEAADPTAAGEESGEITGGDSEVKDEEPEGDSEQTPAAEGDTTQGDAEKTEDGEGAAPEEPAEEQQPTEES
ncbi:Dpy30 domain-containing protein 1 [Plakobranchus ocellatus]|uniref:Dpy30 domain-containing protein 1 n=1 Tax=Plakobranchus ocellatus TaxID=259542 RepID=A0AAV4ACY4_9GAST|nr:Dpy30 domain-containing protein 1 [Plakobranchus ocellatus]